MAKDKSSKTPAGAPEDDSGVSAIESQAPTKRRRGFFDFFRSDKSKSSKNRAGKPQVELSSDPVQNNNITKSASFSEPGSSKEQPTRKVKRHLSVSRSGKMKEVRKRTSLKEVTKRFETEAQV